jgi:sugar phosphate isomerase/epimerase
MAETIHRRHFLMQSSALSLYAAGLASLIHAQANKKPVLKTALNAYSFTKVLNDNVKGRGEGKTLVQILEFAAANKFDGFDATGYFFPGYPKVPSDDTLNTLKKRAADLGVGISGTGVRNNFTTADEAARRVSINHIKEWVEVAAKLGAPVIRVFADTQMRAQTWQTVSNGATHEQVQVWIAAALSECAEQGKKFGVKIGVQNHGDFLQTGQQQLDLIKAVGSPWCLPIVDTGYYKTPDPYVDIALVAPAATNWQIKQSVFGEESDIPTDLIRLLKIVRKSGYSGYLPIETLCARGKECDPFAEVPAFLKKLKDAIAQTA